MSESTCHQDSDALRKTIIAALRTVHDPEIPINIYDLGLIYDLDISNTNDVNVRMTLTSPNCPVAESIPAGIKSAIESVAGVNEVTIDLVWEPPWSPDMMSEAAKLELEFTGHTGPAHLRGGSMTSLSIGKTGQRRVKKSPRSR